jgi:hypothetical protein
MSRNAPPPGAQDELAGLGRKDERPRLNTHADLARAGLSPTEAFVLSRVDGQTSYGDICQLTGLGVEPTLEILRRLQRDRLIVAPGDALPARGAAVPTPKGGGTSVPPAPSLLELHDDGSPVDPQELASGPDLDSVTKARIARLHRRLKTLKAHEFLGVPHGCDAATVRKAYFAASKELHPDRHYGRDIGIFRQKLNEIFAHLTRTFEQLQRK